eukprot:4464851-Prymnesium_polylepis.1
MAVAGQPCGPLGKWRTSSRVLLRSTLDAAISITWTRPTRSPMAPECGEDRARALAFRTIQHLTIQARKIGNPEWRAGTWECARRSLTPRRSTHNPDAH